MKTKQTMLSILLVLCLSAGSFAQSDIEIFGFYQVKLTKAEGEYSVTGKLPAALGGANMVFGRVEQNSVSPAAQQLNLMLRKEFSSNVSTFVNFEIINNFSTEKDWGAFSLEEIWLKYEYASNQSIKGGLLIPAFNNLNEIKNRMPLLPYIFRPLAYEPSIRSIINPSDFLPERAFVQLQGKFYVGGWELNYAAFAGSSESDYIVSGTTAGTAVTGTDTTNFKLFGGRIGIAYDNLRLGVSTSLDKDNQQATLKEDVKRTRIGFDLGYSMFGFTVDGEYIKVILDPQNTTADMNKLFYYGTLAYDFTDQIFAYGTYSYMENKALSYFADGVKNTMVGAGYRAMDNVVLKAQYNQYKGGGNVPITINPALPPISANMDLNFKYYSIALSVLF